MSSFWELQSTQTFSWQSSWWWKLLRLLSPTAQWIICGWISRDEGIHVWWDEGQIMKVINLKKQPKNSKFYSLVSFTKPPEICWKAMEKKAFIWLLCWDHLIALSPNISSLKDETKSHNFDLQWEEESDFYMLWQYKLDKYFNLTFEENSSFNFFVIFNDCLDMLQNLDEIISKPFPVNWVLSQIWDWQTLSWFSLATIF